METLTLEQAYYIAQMVAAVILILSVVYLALQVHQNTHAIRLSNFQAGSMSWANFMGMLTNSEECTDIYRRGIAANDTLNENEQIRFRMLGMHLLRVFHECFEQQYERGGTSTQMGRITTGNCRYYANSWYANVMVSSKALVS